MFSRLLDTVVILVDFKSQSKIVEFIPSQLDIANCFSLYLLKTTFS